MKNLIVILLIFNNYSIYPQLKNNHDTYNNIDSIVNLLESKIDLEQIKGRKLDSLNKELRNQLIIYKAKEDYFASALEDQSNRFSLIITITIAIILSALGFISFSWWRNEKKEINEKFISFNLEFEKIKESSTEINIKLYDTISALFLVSSSIFRDKKRFIESFNLLIASIKYNCKKLETSKEKDYHPAIRILKTSIDNDLTNIIKDNSLKTQLSEKKEDLFKDIEEIQQSGNNELIDLCAKIRITINEYLK